MPQIYTSEFKKKISTPLFFHICRPIPKKLSLLLSVSTTFFVLNVRKIRLASVGCGVYLTIGVITENYCYYQNILSKK